MQLSEINLICADLTQSKNFYTALGCEFRIVTVPGSQQPAAWMSTAGFAPVSLHTAEFATWWGHPHTGPAAGSVVIDLTFDVPAAASRFLKLAAESGGRLVKDLTAMPWGQSYGIASDPDGYLWGVKTSLQDDGGS